MCSFEAKSRLFLNLEVCSCRSPGTSAQTSTVMRNLFLAPASEDTVYIPVCVMLSWLGCSIWTDS